MSRKSNVARQIETETVIEPVVAIEGIVEQVVEAPVEIKIEAVPEYDFTKEVDVMKAGESYLIGYYGNKSKAIRGLSALGHKCGPISRALNIRFQHARNVLNKPLKRLIKEEREAAKLGVNVELEHDDSDE
jgi:predicted RNA-binding protein YlqC (UPF0109 family)